MRSGFFNIDKRRGDTSAYVVNRIKRLVKTPCGHLGTLDPLASGVLPVGVGNATRLFDYFLQKRKTYLARFFFGATTDTLDGEGEPYGEGPVPAKEEILSALPRFTGEIAQVPPKYSARCVNGRRGYELARKGAEFELAGKKTAVYSFRLLGQVSPAEYEFEIVCGGGTYIRSLARDLAASCGTLGYVTCLRRTASGIFTEETAVPLEKLTAENAEEFLIPTDSVLPFPALEVEDARFYNGVPLPTDREDGVYKIYRGGEFYGTGSAEEGVLRPLKKLC